MTKKLKYSLESSRFDSSSSAHEKNKQLSGFSRRSSSSLLSISLHFKSLLAIIVFICLCHSQILLAQAENNIGCLLDPSVCEPYEYCYRDLGTGGVCLSDDDIQVAEAAAEATNEAEGLDIATRSQLNGYDGNDDDADDEDDEDDDDVNNSVLKASGEYEIANDDDENDEYERGPIMQSLRSEEATPLYLADAPIRVHKYNFQQINQDDDKIDDFVRYIENVNGQSGSDGDNDDDDDDDDDDNDDSEDENAQQDYKSRVLNLFFNKIGLSSNRNSNSKSEANINNQLVDALIKAENSNNQNSDDDDEDEDDGNQVEPYLQLTDPKRSIDADKFVLLTKESGVPPIGSNQDDDDDSDEASSEDSSEDKILERIHHDLKENILIEKLIDQLQADSSSDSLENDNDDQDVKKRFKPVENNNDFPSKYQNAANFIADQENMLENEIKSLQSESPEAQDEYIDDSYIFIETSRILSEEEIKLLMNYISTQSSIPLSSFKNITQKRYRVMFQLENADRLIGDSNKIMQKIVENGPKILHDKRIKINSYGIGRKTEWSISRSLVRSSQHPFNIDPNSERFILITLVTCVTLTSLLIVLTVVYMCKRRSRMSDSLLKNVSDTPGGPVYRINFSDDESLIQDNKRSSSGSVFVRAWRRVVETIKCASSRRGGNYTAASQQSASTAAQTAASGAGGEGKEAADYQELCRQRAKGSGNNKGNVSPTIVNERPDSPRSSTSSWSEEPIKSQNIDITTGHSILTYMEEHLNDKNRLQEEWTNLCEYESEPNKCEVGSLPENMTKNRYSNILPFDHSRVKLKHRENDYINANYIIDDDPRHPSYIAAQGPLMHTTNDFWHMIWEEESVVIVSLCRTIEYGSAKCHQFWPSNGSCVYDKFEIHLVSEHVWCEDYLVRNFFLKNLEQNQTRTVTQFHFLTWPENGVPQNIKSFLDFRRRVNKSFKTKSSPLVIHCNDGVGRTGTYLLIDMVLNKISKGAKEIDIAATLEYLKDQRPGIVKNKTQFEYSFAVITEELHNMLKALRQ